MSAVRSASALEHTFAVYDLQGRATPIEYTADFWQVLQRRYGDFAGRTLVSGFAFDRDWPNWEIHPHGDELVCALRGDFDLVLDEPQGLRRVRLAQPGDFAIVPRGTWHTAWVHAPSAALFITPGQGTMNRAVDPHGGDPASPRGAEAGGQPASLDQVNLVCADFDATLRFYRELGLSVREAPPSPDGIRHATALNENAVRNIHYACVCKPLGHLCRYTRRVGNPRHCNTCGNFPNHFRRCCGFQLFGFIPIGINDRMEEAYVSLQAQAAGAATSDVEVKESWIYAFVGTSYYTTLQARQCNQNNRGCAQQGAAPSPTPSLCCGAESAELRR